MAGLLRSPLAMQRAYLLAWTPAISRSGYLIYNRYSVTLCHTARARRPSCLCRRKTGQHVKGTLPPSLVLLQEHEPDRLLPTQSEISL
jgi:hypothetical protein